MSACSPYGRAALAELELGPRDEFDSSERCSQNRRFCVRLATLTRTNLQEQHNILVVSGFSFPKLRAHKIFDFVRAWTWTFAEPPKGPLLLRKSDTHSESSSSSLSKPSLSKPSESWPSESWPKIFEYFCFYRKLFGKIHSEYLPCREFYVLPYKIGQPL